MDDLPWLVNIREERKLGGYHFAYYNIQQSISQQTVLSHNSVNSHKSPKIDSFGVFIFYIEKTSEQSEFLLKTHFTHPTKTIRQS